MESKPVPEIEIVSMNEHIDFMTKVELAREMLPGDKMMLGIEMFQQACEDVRLKVLAAFPDAPAQAVDESLRLLIERTDRA